MHTSITKLQLWKTNLHAEDYLEGYYCMAYSARTRINGPVWAVPEHNLLACLLIYLINLATFYFFIVETSKIVGAHHKENSPQSQPKFFT